MIFIFKTYQINQRFCPSKKWGQFFIKIQRIENNLKIIEKLFDNYGDIKRLKLFYYNRFHNKKCSDYIRSYEYKNKARDKNIKEFMVDYAISYYLPLIFNILLNHS
jgi:hypothetical protein